MIEIHEATTDDIPALYALYDAMGKNDTNYFEDCFHKGFKILLASSDGQYVGFTILNFTPKYALYKRLDIPEIQDLNVIPDARQKGIATTIVNKCEEMAEAAGKTQIGISVPLNASYGPAQRLYIKLGYMPDGNGITYDREPVQGEQRYPADDDLCLMMLKDL